MKQLALITDHHLNSGIGRYSFELAKAMILLRKNVELYKPYKTDSEDNVFDNRYQWLKRIRYKSFRSLHPYVLPYFIGGSLLGSKAQVYHAHWFMAGLGAMKAARRNVIVTMHDVSLLHEQERTGRFLDYYKKSLQKFIEKEVPIVVVSKQARQDAIHFGGIPAGQVHAIYNGINTSQFFPLHQKRQEGPFRLVYSGGLGPRKNIALLLKACRILEDRKVDYQLNIAGNHPDATPYPAMCKQLKLQNVCFTGFIPDEQMNAFYNAADLMVFTSKYEGFGFSPLEAMAAGLPVISTRGGSLSEVSGGGAMLVADDAEDIANSIIQLKDDPVLYEYHKQRGMDWVKQYTWEATAQQTLALYQKTLAA